MPDLYVINGYGGKRGRIERITVDYRRVSKVQAKNGAIGTWDYSERLVIDRMTETMEHVQNVGTGCIVARKLKVEEGVEALLDDLSEVNLFQHIAGNPPDVIENPNETKEYKITIHYEKGLKRIIQGTFDKWGLPDDWEQFAQSVFWFMYFYGLGEMFDPSNYNKVKRRQREYIFCSVVFEGGWKTYYYLTDDDTIEIGDFVIVPAGKENRLEIVKVVDIEYFTRENAPFPVEKTKWIVRKCTDDDFRNKDGEE